MTNTTPNLVLFDTTGVFATPQTITLDLGPLTLTNPNVPGSIAGDGATNLAVSGGNTQGVFSVISGNQSLSGMKITGGNTYSGGGVYLATARQLSRSSMWKITTPLVRRRYRYWWNSTHAHRPQHHRQQHCHQLWGGHRSLQSDPIRPPVTDSTIANNTLTSNTHLILPVALGFSAARRASRWRAAR